MKEFVLKIRFDLHELYHCEMNKSIVECTICKARRETQEELNVHYTECHSNPYYEQKTNLVVEEAKMFVENNILDPVKEREENDLQIKIESYFSISLSEFEENNVVWPLSIAEDEKLKPKTRTLMTKLKSMVIKKEKCFKCKLIFKNRKQLKIHKKKYHRKKPKNLKISKSQDNPQVKNVKYPIICVICKESLNTLRTYLEHYNSVHKVKIQASNLCKICNRQSNNRTNHLNHMIAVHSRHKPYSCRFCHEKYNYKSYLNKKGYCKYNNHSCIYIIH